MPASVPLSGEFTKGLWKESPVFRQLLGMCPTLAVTNSAINGFAMGLAVLFVMTCSSTIISTLRKLIPTEVRIGTSMVIIASFVTIADLFLAAKFPVISKALGPYVPLIVVNCIIWGRQEAFALRSSIGRSILDALGMGVGFTLSLVVLGAVREFLGAGSVFDVQLLGTWFNPWIIMILPGGAFLTLGILVGVINLIGRRQ